MLHCKECNSTDIGWDGWIDQNGEVINKFNAAASASSSVLNL